MASSFKETQADCGSRRFAGAKRGSGAAIVVGVMVAVGLVQGPPAAGDLEDDKQQVDSAAQDAHGDVLAVDKKVAKATKRVVKVRDKLPAANAELARAASAQAQADGQNRKAELELDQARGDVRAAKARLGRIENAIDELRGDVGGFARRAYQMGPFTELELLLDAKSPSDFTHRMEAIRVITESSGVALTTMSRNRADLGNTRIELEALRENAVEKSAVAETRLVAAEQTASRASAAKQTVDDLLEAEEIALSTVKSKRAQVKAAYEKLAAEQARLEAEIAEAVRRAERRAKREAARRAAAKREAARREAARREAAKREAAKRGATKPSAGQPAKPKKPSGGGSNTSPRNGSSRSRTPSGEWLFPIRGGYIGSEAGWRYHPVLHYTKCHTGADISASSGTPIRAAADGLVIMAGWAGGFGQYTTISHGNSLTSSYAHQSSIGVRNGQRVNRGQTIGYVGNTGLSTGPHLHFEARISGVPYNPRGWLGSGSKSIACP